MQGSGSLQSTELSFLTEPSQSPPFFSFSSSSQVCYSDRADSISNVRTIRHSITPSRHLIGLMMEHDDTDQHLLQRLYMKVSKRIGKVGIVGKKGMYGKSEARLATLLKTSKHYNPRFELIEAPPHGQHDRCQIQARKRPDRLESMSFGNGGAKVSF